MGTAAATVEPIGERLRVIVRTEATNDFDSLLQACKAVPGGRFVKTDGDNRWHYPLSINTCRLLREAFGNKLLVGNDLAEWYRKAAAYEAHQIATSDSADAELTRTPAPFAEWLHGYQRAGALWIARGYRGGGLVADKPGVGKTGETLAGLLEAGITGPVLIVCPRPSVDMVWGKEIRRHMPDTPTYLCSGSRERRTKILAQFANDMHADPKPLRIVVVVAEMLRVEMGAYCVTESGNKVSGMCPQRRKSIDGQCNLHQQVMPDKEKDKVPVDFSYPILFDEPFLRGGWSAVVLDESHKLLGSLTFAKANLMGRGLKLLPQRSNRRRYALSGTPFGKGGRIEGMFGTLHWLWPDEFTSYWKWAAATFEVTDKVINRRGDTAKEIGQLKGLASDATEEEQAEAFERFLRNLGPRVLRRTKEETNKNLPPKIYIEVPCEMTAAQKRQHQQLADVSEIKCVNGIVTPNGHLAITMRMRQIANGEINVRKDASEKVFFTNNSGKIEQLMENLDTRGILDRQPGDKLVIASGFNEFIDVIADELKRLKVPFFQLDGRTADGVRNKILEDWQSNRKISKMINGPGAIIPRVMLVNTKAAGISINLDSADEMHIMDEDPDPGVNEQLEDRIHRASRIHQVRIFYYRTIGTIDYVKAASVEMRRRYQHAVMDGRRGQEYIREMMREALITKER